MYLEVLHYLLTNSESPQHIHRRSEISSFLLGLIKVSLSQSPLNAPCVVFLTSHAHDVRWKTTRRWVRSR